MEIMKKTIQYALDLYNLQARTLSLFLSLTHSLIRFFLSLYRTYAIDMLFPLVLFWLNPVKPTMIPSFQRPFYLLIAVLIILSLSRSLSLCSFFILFVCVYLFITFFSIQLFFYSVDLRGSSSHIQKRYISEQQMLKDEM